MQSLGCRLRLAEGCRTEICQSGSLGFSLSRSARAWCVEEPLPVWREFRRRRPVCRWHRLLACCSQQALIPPVCGGRGRGGSGMGGGGEGEGEWRGGPGEAEALNSPPLFVFPSRRCSHRRSPLPALTAHPRTSCPVQLRPALCVFIRPDFSPVLPHPLLSPARCR